MSKEENMVDVISAQCLDSEHWRIKYRISTIVFDDIFKRVTRLGTSDYVPAKKPVEPNKK